MSQNNRKKKCVNKLIILPSVGLFQIFKLYNLFPCDKYLENEAFTNVKRPLDDCSRFLYDGRG